MIQRSNESAIEFLRRVVHNLNWETEYVNDALPTVESILDYVRMWEVYGTEYLTGIMEVIEEGSDPSEWNKFVRKHKLSGPFEVIKKRRTS